MDAPNKLKVLIEGKDTEETATLIKYDPIYYAAEYESGNGERFYVDMSYIAELQGKPAKIPLEVIRQLKDMRTKLANAQADLGRLQKKDESSLILPPGY